MRLARPQLSIPARIVPEAPVFPAGAWNRAALSGRLVELSAGAEAAHLTAAFGLVLDAQLCGDRAAWVTLEPSSFFPPDVVDGGIDLDALPVVRVPDAHRAGRAASQLVRSGGFGLVVIDLTVPGTTNRLRQGYGGPPKLHAKAEAAPYVCAFPVPLLSRLLGQARQQDVAVILLTKKSHEASSLHSLISLRAEARWRLHEGRYELSVHVLKDKRGGPGWTHVEACRGPAGLR